MNPVCVYGLHEAIAAVKRIKKNDFPASDRSPYTKGARDALTEVERVCLKEIELLKSATP